MRWYELKPQIFTAAEGAMWRNCIEKRYEFYMYHLVTKSRVVINVLQIIGVKR